MQEKIIGSDAIPRHKLSNLTDFVQYVQLSSWDEFPIRSECVCVWSGEAQLFNATVLIFPFICSTWLDWPSHCSSLLFFFTLMASSELQVHIKQLCSCRSKWNWYEELALNVSADSSCKDASVCKVTVQVSIEKSWSIYFTKTEMDHIHISYRVIICWSHNWSTKLSAVHLEPVMCLLT